MIKKSRVRFEKPDEPKPDNKQQWSQYTAYHKFHEARATEEERRAKQQGGYKPLRQRRRELERRRY